MIYICKISLNLYSNPTDTRDSGLKKYYRTTFLQNTYFSHGGDEK